LRPVTRSSAMAASTLSDMVLIGIWPDEGAARADVTGEAAKPGPIRLSPEHPAQATAIPVTSIARRSTKTPPFAAPSVVPRIPAPLRIFYGDLPSRTTVFGCAGRDKNTPVKMRNAVDFKGF
jgi:hypothetical protein